MKCVAEILLIRAEAESNYQAEQKRLDEQAKLKLIERVEKTIEYCETTLNDTFIRKAENRNAVLEISIKGVIDTDRLGNSYFCPLTQEEKYYANGNGSFKPDEKIKYDIETLTQHLQNFCYVVEQKPCTYERYGWGTNRGTEIIISLA